MSPERFEDLPPEVLEGVELDEHLLLIIDGFRELVNDRSYGFGMAGGIYWTALELYVQSLRLSPEAQEFVKQGIRFVDDIYLEEQRKKVPSDG